MIPFDLTRFCSIPFDSQGALTDMAQNLLGDVPSSSSSAIEEGVEPAYFIGSDKRMRFDSMPNAHVAFAFKAPAAGSKDSLSIMMVEALLGEVFLWLWWLLYFLFFQSSPNNFCYHYRTIVCTKF